MADQSKKDPVICMYVYINTGNIHHLSLLAQRFWISDCCFEDAVPGGAPVDARPVVVSVNSTIVLIQECRQ